MPNEFVARNGVIALNNSVITGSLNVTAGITGSLFGTASFATTASFVANAVSASFATTASYVLNAVSASFASTASFIPTSSLTNNFFVQGGNSFGAQAVLGTNDVQNLALETNGSTRMFISSGGNVGIGTTSSLANFQVGNSSALANYQGGLVGMILPTGSGTWIELADNSTNGTAFRISKDSGAGIIFNANGREIGFKADSYSTTMTDAQLILKTSGNVGIGKTTPAAKLDVSGSVIISGNVGIANTSPLNKLHITQGTDTAYPTLGTGKGGLFIAGDNNLYGLYVGINTSDGNSYMQVMRNNTATAYNLILQPVGGNVGIGKTSPNATLDVSGSTIITGSLNVTAGITGSLFGTSSFATSASFALTASFIPTSSLTGNFFVQGGNSFGAQALLGTNDVQNLAFETSGSTRMFISSSGNVGIGTTSPDERLTVGAGNGISIRTVNSGTYGALKFGTNDATYAAAWAGIDSDGEGVGINVSNLRFYTSFGSIAERMRITSAGNVGIGKTTPTAKLDVSGSVIITGSLNVLGSITTTGTLTAQTLVVQTITSSTDFVTGSTRFGSLLANTHQFTGSVSMTGSLAVTGTATISTSLTNPLLIGGTTTTSTITYQPTSGVGTTGADHIFKVGNNGATEAMRILNSGNVGIGTASPTYRTHIETTGADVFLTKNTSTTSFNRSFFHNNLGTGIQLSCFGSAYPFGTAFGVGVNGTVIESNGSNEFAIGTTVAHPLILGTNGTERMRIISAGNVLIGTTTAGANGKLQVSGSIGLSGNSEIRQNTNSDGSTLKILATQFVGASTNSAGYGYSGGGIIASVSAADSTLLLDAGRTTSTDGRFKIANTTSSNTSLSLEKNGVYTLFASTSGNVGIGTGTPNAKLDVSGSLNISGSGVQVPLQVSSGSTSLLFVSQSGNVGIGTTSPTARLQLGTLASVSTATPQTISLGGTFSNSAGSNIKLKVYDDGTSIGGISVSDGQLEVNAWSTGKIAFYRGTTQSAIIDASGSVGIGTISPAYKLDVSGSARVQSGLVAPLLFNRITTTYTLVLTDQGKMIEADFSTNIVITVPLNSNVAFPIGTEIAFVKRGSGNAQIIGESGFAGSVTVNSVSGLYTLKDQYGVASLVKVDTNEWYLYGNLL